MDVGGLGKQNQDSSPSRERDNRTPSLRGVWHLSLSGPPPSSGNHQPIHPYVNARGPTLPLIAHFASALVSAVCPEGLGWLVVLLAPHALSESLPAPATPSKGTFLCLCPPHGAPLEVGRDMRLFRACRQEPAGWCKSPCWAAHTAISRDLTLSAILSAVPATTPEMKNEKRRYGTCSMGTTKGL